MGAWRLTDNVLHTNRSRRIGSGIVDCHALAAALANFGSSVCGGSPIHNHHGRNSLCHPQKTETAILYRSFCLLFFFTPNSPVCPHHAIQECTRSPDSCTIAWIAALPIERAAAEAMLDEEHAALTGFARHKTDANIYTWGRIGKPQDCKIPCAALWSHHDHSVSKNRTVPLMDCEPAFRMTCDILYTAARFIIRFKH
ncbi:Putative Pfs, NACHT and Ankyrin domain protein [Aspergillus calidoustus]|uniref:Putative Pfs, NACHT and Ankyrin domain protein n=1 Tax=Aspergillus calidoustus TaxID=454130 RepID=A0A0U5CC17_ASPCI|nr:Putative Pfs, NACHT and Ankyrin domain protein [Aspergillus calidoustus]